MRVNTHRLLAFTYMGPPYLAAASRQELIELVPTMLTPGMAKPFSFA